MFLCVWECVGWETVSVSGEIPLAEQKTVSDNRCGGQDWVVKSLGVLVTLSPSEHVVGHVCAIAISAIKAYRIPLAERQVCNTAIHFLTRLHT